MFKRSIYLIIFLSFFKGYAQNLEFGLGGGGTNTRTDISNFNFKNTLYGFQGFVRWNFTYAWVVRLDYKFMEIGASDNNNSTPISKIRNRSFQSTLQQVTINGEYNFLDFRSLNRKIKFCPYITAGIGFNKLPEPPEQYGSGANNINFCIPFGLGVKYVLTKKLNLGAVFETTKTFNDRIDNLNSTYPTTLSQHQKGVDNVTFDWYYFFGINLSYTLYTIECPDFYDL